MEKTTSYERYETYRKAKGLTDYKVAKECGMRQSTLTCWKQGKYTPKVDKLMLIADLLGVPLEALLGIKPRYGYED